MRTMLNRIVSKVNHKDRTSHWVALPALAVIIALGGLLPIGKTIVHAQSPEICTYDQENNTCLDDWGNGGNGTAIKAGLSGWPNEDFFANFIDMCNGGKATSTCPIDVSGVNLTGDNIFDLIYTGSSGRSGCLATGANDPNTVLGSCPSSTGNGGSDGTIFVGDGSFLINRHWSNQEHSAAYLEGAGITGTQDTIIYGDVPPDAVGIHWDYDY